MMDAREALEQGLVARVVTPPELLPLAKEMARTIAAKAPLAISAALECIVEGIDETIEEGLGRESDRFGALTVTEDFHEGTSAFLEKRKPAFKGA
jgi:enoyl-CoA hydratase